MSPTSDAVERLAQRHGVPVLEAVEYYLSRVDDRMRGEGMDREHAERVALFDVELWAKIWIGVKGDRGPQLGLQGVRR